MNNKIIISISAVLLLAVGLIWFLNQRRSDLTDELQAALSGEKISVLANSKFSDEIQSFYADREYMEVWHFNGSLSKTGKEMLAQIENSKFDGLQPEDYNLAKIYEFSSNQEKENKKFRNLSAEEKVTLELLLSDSFFSLAHDLEKGKVNPSNLDANWKFEEKETDVNYTNLLENVANGSSVEKAFASLYPSSDLYAHGRDAIKELYRIQENDTLTWEFAAVEGAIKVGEKHSAIPALRKRLIFWDVLKPYDTEDPLLFDSTMFTGLQNYQASNGMNPDGVIGALVAESLNNSPQNLIDIASINMERLRWMPAIDWDQEMVLVNVANYQLDYMQKSDTAFSAKVIVGKEYNESPAFTAPMSYIVFSPYWNIPESITNEEIIPSIKKNSNYLSQKNMEVVNGSGEVVKASNVNLSKDQGYRVRQKPGGDNSLGLVKFMFPNEYNIYIHDTPARSLFEKETRALSHGCIRIQNPDQFAKILLDNSDWDDEKIQDAMHQDKEEVVKLDRDIPVMILYMTFWADKNGKANFRSDVYNRDAALLKALRINKSGLDQA
ncbi:murein L,D-transpeptidase YcbB/YkuD [Algoriphagus ratkowskyi]|uniref:L,D-transpeptidase family protein n=1 Tax=Algoriphagus ratkowskyi TaxID=57028 RepID=A0A2W7RJU1_9BACT|nr:L,D-transpeptidase family protein [Algoriphagus ratkowskyi]PZX61108.1 murein L,D-transpeptidase YcbB/YkuD [Algoriphagus ratkowskyi]TXD79238.1 L,D-transpeptidase family protein [Algoriphagus ratkowskyi]